MDNQTGSQVGKDIPSPACLPDVFNPFSLLTCLSKGKLGMYWFATGTPTYLVNMMRRFGVLPSQLGSVRAKAASFDAATDPRYTK